MTNEDYDIIIIGGGIYGIMLVLESALRAKRVLLLEGNDFCGATSYNHLRTLHGGLRYLQSMDMKRFIESVRERRWFLTHFPQFCEVLPCLMPIYGKGLRRRPVLRAAFLANDFLSFKRNVSVSRKRHLPGGRIISAEETKKIFPNVDDRGLKGSALWYDGTMPEHQRLSIEILLWACEKGAEALNYVNVDGLIKKNNVTIGVKAIDREHDDQLEFKAPVVVNATGPWNREIAKAFDRDYPILFERRILNWNILFKRKALSSHALALTPHKGAGHTYFFHNWKNRLLVGTGEVPLDDSCSNFPTEMQIHSFIHDLNSAVPGLSLSMDDIEHVYSGVLPGTTRGKLAKSDVIINHENNGGPKGLFSVSGVKYTTSRRVAQKTLDLIFPDTKNRTSNNTAVYPVSSSSIKTFGFDWMPSDENKGWLQALKQLIDDESVVHVDDLLFRRTSLGENKRRLSTIIPHLRDIFPLNDHQWREELKRLTAINRVSSFASH